MATVECKECGADIPKRCGLSTLWRCHQEPKPKFSFVDLIHKISVPLVLSVAGTVITILGFFSMEGERRMEQTRKLLADAFDKDPIKQQYCIFYVDHLLASGRISPQMTVGSCRQWPQMRPATICGSTLFGRCRNCSKVDPKASWLT